jgi:uncharacterized protein YecT (DUF1311 family)
MSRRRDIAEELARTRERSIKGFSHLNLEWGLWTIEEAIKYISEKLNGSERIFPVYELLKYVPIATAACMETFFRSIVEELIDRGEPYGPRAAKLMESQFKFDYGLLWAVHKKQQFSIGEFMAYIVPLNNLETINSALSILLDNKFLAEVKRVDLTSKRWKTEGRFDEKAEWAYGAIGRLIETRNVIAHETPGLSRFTSNDQVVLEGYEATKLFLIAADNYFWNLLHADEPKDPTQADLNEYAGKQYEHARNDLAAAVEEYKTFQHDPGRSKKLDELQQQWFTFAKARARFIADAYEGGSISPLIYARALESSTKARTLEIRKDMELESPDRPPRDRVKQSRRK